MRHVRRVWPIGPSEWGWEAAHESESRWNGAAWHSIYARGTETSRRKAVRAANAAAAAEIARQRAAWRATT